MSRMIASLFFAVAFPFSAPAQDATETRAEIQAMFGMTPGFVTGIADAALPGLWKQYKELGMSTDTALDAKTRALISLAVAAQIPCQYCIWMDTNSARGAGATDQEIAEAVAISGMTRNWSAIFYGTQTDFEQFRKELGG